MDCGWWRHATLSVYQRPSSWGQHHCAVLMWLLRMTIRPAADSVTSQHTGLVSQLLPAEARAETAASSSSMAVPPTSSGLAVSRSARTTGFSGAGGLRGTYLLLWI